MAADELVRIYTTYDVNEADVVRMALQDEGIRCQLDNEHQAGLSHVLPVALLVRSEDTEHALQVIEDYQSRLGQESPEEDEVDGDYDAGDAGGAEG